VDAENCKREVMIEIPPEAVRQETQNVTSQFQRVARIPGFRPGKAPAALIRQRYREDIKTEVVQALVPKYFEESVKTQKFAVVGKPQFEDLKFEEDQPLTIKAKFEIIPEFELKLYKGLETEQAEAKVADSDVDMAVGKLQDNAATFEVVENRPAEDGDYLTVNYEGRSAQDANEQPISARDVQIHLGEKDTVRDFSENLRGAKSGEVREFDVAYAADYPRKALAGKTFHYRVEVTAIKKKVVPAADDELAKTVSEFARLDELRAHLRERLAERRKQQAEAEAKQKLMEVLVKAHEFPVPEALVENQLDRKLERFVTQLMAQGIDPRTAEIDWRKIREDGRPDAVREVRASLILERIAESEKLEVTEEELDGVIRELAESRHEPPAALKTRLTRDGDLDRIKSTHRNQKALDFIYRNARINPPSERGPAPEEGRNRKK
jgi:trigger factor